jgi:hypothetical protein
MPTANQQYSSLVSQFSRTGFSTSLPIHAISRSTITDGKSVLVCGIIATRSSCWKSRCSLTESPCTLHRMRCRVIRKGAVIAFGLVLVIVQIGDTYLPRTPLTDKATAIGVWVFYTLFVLMAFAVEKIGSRKGVKAP